MATLERSLASLLSGYLMLGYVSWEARHEEGLP